MKTNERDLSVTLPAWSVAFKVSWLGPGSGWYEVSNRPSAATSIGLPLSSSEASGSLSPRTASGLWRTMPPSAGSPIDR